MTMGIKQLQKDLQSVEIRKDRRKGYVRVWKPIFEKYKINVICELGVREGKNFHDMIESNPTEAVAVDPWKEDGIQSRNDLGQKQAQLDALYENFKKSTADKPFVKIFRDYSFNVVKEFPDEYFDVVYIDADHTYQACLQDMRDWYPKVKKGGVLCGDDYRVANFRGVVFGVIEAVDTFTKENKVDFFEFPRLGWAIIKPQ